MHVTLPFLREKAFKLVNKMVKNQDFQNMEALFPTCLQILRESVANPDGVSLEILVSSVKFIKSYFSSANFMV